MDIMVKTDRFQIFQNALKVKSTLKAIFLCSLIFIFLAYFIFTTRQGVEIEFGPPYYIAMSKRSEDSISAPCIYLAFSWQTYNNLSISPNCATIWNPIYCWNHYCKEKEAELSYIILRKSLVTQQQTTYESSRSAAAVHAPFKSGLYFCS